MSKMDGLTPVQQIGDFWFKRDDLFMPFEDVPLNGGKVRQALCLFRDAHSHILNDCSSTITTATGINSPQGIIVSRAAREFGFRSVVFIGGTKVSRILSSPDKYALMNNILAVGGEIDDSSKVGYTSVIEHAARKWSQENGNAFYVKFGINLKEWNSAIVGSVSNQVENLPDDLDLLIVPVGSGIMLAGILKGLSMCGKRVGKVIGIQISGHEIADQISEMSDSAHPFELLVSRDFPYAKPVKISYQGLDLDWLYEGKAFWYANQYLKEELRRSKTCFWLVGNSTPARTTLFKGTDDE